MYDIFDLLLLKIYLLAIMCVYLGVYFFLFIFSLCSCIIDRQNSYHRNKSILTVIYYFICLAVIFVSYIIYSASHYMNWENAFLSLIVIPLLIIRFVLSGRINNIYEMRQIVKPSIQSLMRTVLSMVRVWRKKFFGDDICHR